MNNNGFFSKLKKIGPGTIAAAAIVGPGTVTAASTIGANYGYSLIWVLIFSVVATGFLLEMAARLGVMTGMDLGKALRQQFDNPFLKFLTIALIVLAVGVGNAAYETGNMIGGAIGLTLIAGTSPQFGGIIIGLASGLILWFGSYQVLEKIFMIMVGILSISFLITGIVISPDIGKILAGLIPVIPEGSIRDLISMVGTTIVPYTLFLQSATVLNRWKEEEALSQSRVDIVASMVIVGIISIAITVTAAAAFPIGSSLGDGSEMAVQLEPLLGTWAKYVFSVGIIAAGITSAMTAPLAASYALSGLFGWELNMKNFKFRIVWIVIIVIGVLFSGFGYDPVEAVLVSIYLAGLLLPIVVLFLIFVMNNSKYLGKDNTNKTWLNIVSWIVFAVTVFFALNSFGII